MLSRKVSSECIAKYWLVNLLWTKSCLLIEFDFLRTIYLFHFLKNAYIFFYLLFVAVTIYIGHNWTWCWFRNVSWECSWPLEAIHAYSAPSFPVKNCSASPSLHLKHSTSNRHYKTRWQVLEPVILFLFIFF